MNQISERTFAFLKNLARNNNREWFQSHKSQYLDAKANAEAFMDQLIHEMNRHDDIETPSGKKSLYWIYNDVRFSKDKTPYNPRFAGYLRRLKPALRGGYYIWIRPGGSRIGCGFANPSPDDLKRMRLDIESNYEEWHKILKQRSIRGTFGVLDGSRVKTAPRGFSVDHPAIDLLRLKQYWFEHQFEDKEVLSEHFAKRASKTFQAIRPFFDYMSEVLTTDLNGESMLK